ncbi:MAG: hypothetical protein GF347_04370 [Candidatus Moranbacteria bacterium]|nr:hypothetical protein [Candidatus Moranbacteria bacterium]
MILGGDEILKKVKEKELVKNLSERELEKPEGPGFDLRVDEVYQIAGGGFLGLEERKTPMSELAASRKEGDRFYILNPDDFVLIRTIEEVNIDKQTFARIFARSTLFRSGVMLMSGKVSPGYYGKLTFGLKNVGPAKFKFELGARVAFIVFSEIKGKSSLSRGQWKGGRVSADDLEAQV